MDSSYEGQSQDQTLQSRKGRAALVGRLHDRGRTDGPVAGRLELRQVASRWVAHLPQNVRARRVRLRASRPRPTRITWGPRRWSTPIASFLTAVTRAQRNGWRF